jgi:hypothetical protein
MQYPQQGQNSPMNIDQMQNAAMNVVEGICGILSMPVEIILRPYYGTQYFPVPVVFFSAVFMILLAAFSAMATGVTHLLPFIPGLARSPAALFGMGSLVKLYFLMALIHGFRLWRRMLHPELESHSQYEGPALPFFRLLPRGQSFWFTRIVLEPAVVFIGSSILGNLLIFQSGLCTYLHIAALALLIKNFIGWFRSWKFLRDLMDMQNSASIISRLMHNEPTTQEELSQIHMASLPKDIPPDIRQAAVERMADRFSLKINTKEDSTHAR